MEMRPDSRAIAIVDDDAGVRVALGRILGIAGLRAQGFATREDFVAAVPAADFACAVIDVNLGSSNGLDLAGHPAIAGTRLPLIFISGRAEESVRARAIALGCIQFLRKPFMPVELLDAIHRATQPSSPIR